MRGPTVLASLILFTIIAGCSYRAVETNGSLADRSMAELIEVSKLPIPSVLEELYAEIDQTVSNYRQSIELIEAGSGELGQQGVAEAQASLDDLVNRCRAINGCDLTRALTAYQQIVSLQGEVFRSVEVIEDEEPVGQPEPLQQSQPMGAIPPGTRILNGQDLDSLIQDNRHVNEALNDWLTWRRPLLMSSYENYQYLRDSMAPAFDAAGLPEALLFGIVAVESGGKVHAYSRVGAAGPLQFMPATGSRYGLGSQGSFDQRMDPNKAARAAVVYLNDQMRRLDNSLEKVLAAYNAGENRIARLNRRLGGKDFWSSEFFYALPRDTRAYVPDVLAAARLYMHPEQYALQFPHYGTAQTQLMVETDLSLGELAACLGNEGQSDGWFRTLRNLNPQIKASERVTAGQSVFVPQQLVDLYARNCRNQTWLTRLAALHDAAYGDGADDFVPYVVQRGDTMSQVAKRHQCSSLKEIAAINNIAPPRYPLRAGKTLRVPSC